MASDLDKFKAIQSAYSKLNESDSLHRTPMRVIQHGKDADGRWNDETTLDGNISLRGRASALRDHEVAKSSHADNIIRCYEENRDYLEKLAKDMDNENEWRIAIDIRKVIEGLSEAAEEAKISLGEVQYDINKAYHVGDMLSGRFGRDAVSHTNPLF